MNTQTQTSEDHCVDVKGYLIPVGYALVPKNPTLEMLNDGVLTMAIHGSEPDKYKIIETLWKGMIATSQEKVADEVTFNFSAPVETK